MLHYFSCSIAAVELPNIKKLLLISSYNFVQALTGLHLRAGVIVAILTLCNLFIGWAGYVNLGFEHCNFKR